MQIIVNSIFATMMWLESISSLGDSKCTELGGVTGMSVVVEDVGYLVGRVGVGRKAMDIVDFNSLVGVASVAETKGTVKVDMTVDVDENVEQPLVDNVSCLLVLALVAVVVAVVVEVLTVVDVVRFHVLVVEIVYSEVAVVAPPSVDCHCRPFGSAMSSHPSLDVVQMLQEMRIQQRHKCTHACTESKTTFMLKCIKKECSPNTNTDRFVSGVLPRCKALLKTRS